MAKFCPMCGQVTNCTDNCKSCMSEEKMYTLYVWFDDDEGGYGVFKREQRQKVRGRFYEELGDFNTIEELTNLILMNDPDNFEKFAAREAKVLMDTLRESEEDEYA